LEESGTEQFEWAEEPEGAAWRAGTHSLVVCLIALTGVGIIACLVVLVVSLSASGDDLPGSGLWDGYLAAGALWGVGVGGFGIWKASRTLRIRARTAAFWLTGCDLGILFLFLWPLQVIAVGGVLAARASSKAAWTRVGTVALAALVAVGGSVWGIRGLSATDLHSPKLTSPTVLAGTWRAKTGAEIVLRQDGTFSATAAGAIFETDPFGPNHTTVDTAAGTWTVGDGAQGKTELKISPAPDVSQGPLDETGETDVYDVSSTRVLCVSLDPDEPCSIVFRRVG
jgi:hypothetical protein